MKKKTYKLSEEQIRQIVAEYQSRLPNGTWTSTPYLAQKFDVTPSAVRYYLLQYEIPLRSNSEAHAGMKCKPIKNLPPAGQAPPLCKCGCSNPVAWNQRKNGWDVYVHGHYRPKKLYHDEDWLREQYFTINRTVAEIADEFGVTPNAILKAMRKAGISRRNASEAHIGRQAGENNPAWKGGVTPERQRLYKNGHWLEFCAEIYARDNYTCQRCGAPKKEPKSLHAHHLKPWGDEPALRFEKSNMVTLCRDCHEWVHSKANVNREFLQ